MRQAVESEGLTLAGSRALLEAVLAHLADGVTVVSATGERLYANDVAARLNGFDTAAALLAAPSDLLLVSRADGSPVDHEDLPGARALRGEDAEPMVVRFRRRDRDGPERVAEVSAVAVRDTDGTPLYVLSYFREVSTEREHGSSEVSRVLGATLDYEEAVRGIAGATVPELADWCLLDLLDDRGALVRVATAHVDPAKAKLLEELHRLWPSEPGEVGAGRVVETGRPELARELGDEHLVAVSKDDEHLRALREIGFRSYLCVPIKLGDRVLGAVTFLTADTPRHYSANDVALAEEVAARAASALENAALYREAQRTTALLDSLYESAPIGLGFWDRDLRYVRVNEALAVINERPREEHVGKTFAEVIPHLAERIEPVARSVLETREPVVALQVTSGTPGDPQEERHWLASYYPVLATDGQVLGVGGVVEEITDRQRAEERTALQHAVTRILSDAETVATAVPRVLEALCASLGWDVAAYWPVDPGEPRVTWARPGVLVDAFLETTRSVPLTPELLIGRVAESGRAEWLEDLHEGRFARAAVAESDGLVSGLAFPIVIDGAVAAVLEAFSRVRRREDPELLGALVSLGGQLGQFIRRKEAEQERHGLLERERAARAEAESVAATLRKLERVSEAALAHASLHDLLDALLERIVEVLDADTASILLLGEKGLLQVRATVGFERQIESEVPIPLGSGMAGRIAATRTPLLVDDLSTVELVSPVLRERGINSLVAIPLVVEGDVIGVVHAGSEAYAHFAPADLRLLELIADRIALAINHAALSDETRLAQERLEFLSEASVVLASSLDLDLTLRSAARLAVARFADAAIVDLVVGDGISRVVIEIAEPRLSGAIRAGLLAHPPSLADEGGSAKVIRTGEPELLLDLDVDPSPLASVTLGRPGISSTVERLKPRSLVYMPLTVRGQVLGVLALIRTQARFDERDVETVRELAARAAVALDNAQLYQAAEERAQASRVLASVGDGVFLVDHQGFVRTWNRAAAAATGLAPSAVVDRRAEDVIPGWAAVSSRVPIAREGAPTRAESLPLDLGGRELWLSLHGVALPDGTVFAFRDLTEERALESMRTEFVSTVSHELRTPLAAIYGAAMTLRRSDVTLDEDQRERLLDIVSGEADRLARTVNDILWASRLDTGSLHVSMQRCDPYALAQEVVVAQRAHLDRGHELVLRCEEGLPDVSGDPDKVGRVLINLVDNAIKYSPDGGKVDVDLRQSAGHVRFSVLDRGLGIPLAEQRRIFEKFYRLDPDMTRGVGGTGLGLYICRELVRRMGGRIWVDSEGLGAGSSFHVELPVAGEFPASADPPFH